MNLKQNHIIPFEIRVADIRSIVCNIGFENSVWNTLLSLTNQVKIQFDEK